MWTSATAWGNTHVILHIYRHGFARDTHAKLFGIELAEATVHTSAGGNPMLWFRRPDGSEYVPPPDEVTFRLWSEVPGAEDYDLSASPALPAPMTFTAYSAFRTAAARQQAPELFAPPTAAELERRRQIIRDFVGDT